MGVAIGGYIALKKMEKGVRRGESHSNQGSLARPPCGCKENKKMRLIMYIAILMRVGIISQRLRRRKNHLLSQLKNIGKGRGRTAKKKWGLEHPLNTAMM